MSEKKNKTKRSTLNIPQYDQVKQAEWMLSFARMVNIPIDILTSVVLADFIMNIDCAYIKTHTDYSTVFFSFLAHHLERVNNYKALCEEDNAEKK